jgi:hypothetical protein
MAVSNRMIFISKGGRDMIKAGRNRWRDVFLVLMLTLVIAPANALCSAADVNGIMKQMKEVLEPARPSIQKIVITKSERGESQQIVLLQAFKKLPDGKRRLMIVLEPADLKNMTALLWESGAEKADIIWIYLPDINRVKKMLGLSQYDPFLGTTFTYADLGFVKLRGKYALLSEETCEGEPAYKVEEKRIPGDYYSRIINWIAVDSKMPLRRDFYSAGNKLWKTEVFKDITVIDGTPTPIRILMTLVDGSTSAEFKLAEINYDVNIPDELFDPSRLSTVATHPLWKSYRTQPEKKQ